jgi:hypothetical protein
MTIFQCNPLEYLQHFSTTSSKLIGKALTLPSMSFEICIIGCTLKIVQLQNLNSMFPIPSATTTMMYVSPPQQEHQAVYNTVASHLQLEMPNSPLHVHVEGEPGGEKTYLLNVLLSYSCSIGRLTLPAAFPAKVARKFPGGQTAHHWFVQNVQTICKNTQPQRIGQQLQEARLIFIDEITIMRTNELDALVHELGTKLQTHAL